MQEQNPFRIIHFNEQGRQEQCDHHLGYRLGGRKGERESTGLLEAGNDCMREQLFDFPTHIKGNKLGPSDNKCARVSDISRRREAWAEVITW